MSSPSVNHSSEDEVLNKTSSMNILQNESAPMIDDFLVKYDKPWYRVPHLLYLNFCIFIVTLVSTNNGYDGSMLNGLQSLPIWHDTMQASIDKPFRGAILGALANGAVLGGAFSVFFASYLSDHFGRRMTILVSQVILVVGAMIQGAANGYALFFVGRFILGFGAGIGAVLAAPLISEIAYPTHRPVATACYNTCWYLGLIIASWVTYGTRNLSGNTCWRIPSYLQAAVPAIQILTIWMIPESPRFYLSKGNEEKARAVLMKHHAGGDQVAGKLLVDFEIAEIARGLEMDKIYSQTRYRDFLKTPANRKRLFYCIMVPCMMQLSGNGLVSYYLNLVLNSIGITSTDEQLIINGCLMIYNWVIASGVAFVANRFKRRTLFITSFSVMLVSYVIWTVLSAINQQRNFEQRSLGQGVLAMIFIYYFGYDIGLNGIPFLYLTEVLTYNLRAKGINIMNAMGQIVLVYNGFVNPVAMDAIEWKYYIVYCCIIAVELLIVYFTFVETAGYSLEEVCLAFGEDINDIALGQYIPPSSDIKDEIQHVERV